MMDFETVRLIIEVIIGVLVTPFAFVLWWNFRSLKAQADKTKEDLNEFKLHVAVTHPTQDNLSKAIDGFTDTVREMFSRLDGIRNEIREMSETFRDKLDQKQDRGH